MKRLLLFILGSVSVASDMSTDITFGVVRHDVSGSLAFAEDVDVVRAVYPAVAVEGGLFYPLGDFWGTAMRLKVGGSSVSQDCVEVAQDYDMSAQWLLTYGNDAYVQVGPLWQRSKMNFGWRALNEDLYLDGYGVAFGVYHPLFKYIGLRVNFQHVVNNAVHPCHQNAESKEIGTLKTGVSQLSIALSSDLSVIVN